MALGLNSQGFRGFRLQGLKLRALGVEACSSMEHICSVMLEDSAAQKPWTRLL